MADEADAHEAPMPEYGETEDEAEDVAAAAEMAEVEEAQKEAGEDGMEVAEMEVAEKFHEAGSNEAAPAEGGAHMEVESEPPSPVADAAAE